MTTADLPKLNMKWRCILCGVDQTSGRGCRCVHRDGKEIDACVCKLCDKLAPQDMIDAIVKNVADQRDQPHKLLRVAADMFHKIMSGVVARDMIASDRKLTQPMRERLQEDVLLDADVAAIAGDGFSMCVTQLAEAGYPDCSITSCSPSEVP